MNTQVQEFKKNLILEKAQEYFKAYGYAGVQIDKFAKDLGVGVGTIYSMFGSKEGLFLSWLFSLMEHAYHDLKEYFDTELNPVKQFRYFIDYKLAYYEKERALLKDYIQNNQFFLKNTLRREENPAKKIYLLLSKTVQNLVETKTAKVNDTMLSVHILDNIINGYIERYTQEENIKFTDKTDEILKLYLSIIGVSEFSYE